jgi:hypothetical protein
MIDTTNMLFVCGGAFTGLEKIISARGRSTSIGFGAKVASPEERNALDVADLEECPIGDRPGGCRRSGRRLPGSIACPVAVVKDWLVAANISEGPVSARAPGYVRLDCRPRNGDRAAWQGGRHDHRRLVL